MRAINKRRAVLLRSLLRRRFLPSILNSPCSLIASSIFVVSSHPHPYSIAPFSFQIRLALRPFAENPMDPQTQNTSLQRLQNVERRVVRVLDIAGGVMEELASPSGPKKEFVNSHCREFMQSMKDIQVTLREEIKSACEYRPFEKCDYKARIANEICFQKLEYVLSQLDDLKETADRYPSSD
ncbi:unnamed protein product [Microthlaspi erraticum]|uniref:Mediator of RNA polymerase II transcription subunit 11 n=1 Tax=Microthlaspi erraticum TaxID=1685480 RepID=A0A6D2JFU8_9BRAS|nr:unnamed protein product [Microthlaspi erraticum]